MCHMQCTLYSYRTHLSSVHLLLICVLALWDEVLKSRTNVGFDVGREPKICDFSFFFRACMACVNLHVSVEGLY